MYRLIKENVGRETWQREVNGGENIATDSNRIKRAPSHYALRSCRSVAELQPSAAGPFGGQEVPVGCIRVRGPGVFFAIRSHEVGRCGGWNAKRERDVAWCDRHDRARDFDDARRHRCTLASSKKERKGCMAGCAIGLLHARILHWIPGVSLAKGNSRLQLSRNLKGERGTRGRP